MQNINNKVLSTSYLEWLESLKINPNYIIPRHYLDYLETIKTKPNLISQTLSDSEIQELRDTKYQLTEFDIYKYIYAHDYLINSLSCNNIKLTEGITKDTNKYNNILINLFYQNIPSEIISFYPISVIFSIKQKGNNITDLTNWDKYTLSLNKDLDNLGYMYDDLKRYKLFYRNYAGNSYTYYKFKQLIKLLLTEVYLYEYSSFTFTYEELVSFYQYYISNCPDPSSIKSIKELIESGEAKKVKYQCIKVMEPENINEHSISELKLYLIDVNKIGNFESAYDSLIEKHFYDFWNSDATNNNIDFMNVLKKTRKQKID
jgi:hypothetical protein